MQPSTREVSDELAHVVWASVILSLRNPYTITATENTWQRNHEPSDVQSDEEEDDGVEDDIASIEAGQLTSNGDVLREKFLDSISELLAHTKGGMYVTATALRETEEHVEVDIARNSDFNSEGKRYLASLKRFLAMQADDTSQQALSEYSHQFLVRTVDYSAARVNAQVEAVVKLLNDALYRPIQQAVSEQYTQDNCLLGCCSAGEESISTQTGRLLSYFLNFNLWRSRSTEKEQKKDRREIVELAAATTRSRKPTQATQAALEEVLPAVHSPRLMQLLRMLARPVTNLRILRQVARLLPHFQQIEFLTIQRPPPLKLGNHQVPALSQAWKRLGLAVGPNRRIPAALARKNRDFKRHCTLDLFIHCEIQLLTRYEADPSSSPTFPYFGG